MVMIIIYQGCKAVTLVNRFVLFFPQPVLTLPKRHFTADFRQFAQILGTFRLILCIFLR